MERVWELARLELYQLRRDHLDWSQTQLAAKLGYSLSWVKKWLRRFRQAKTMSLDVFKSQSRAPQHNPRTVQPLVRQAILGFRDALREKYHRSVGAKTILYHLHHDPWLKQQNVYLPRSSRIIWQVLKDGGRIPTRVRDHHPLERPEPMQFWEMDFGQLGDAFEFFVWIDRGTSILVDTDTQSHFNAESTLLSLANTFVTHGLPEKIRCDNDARFVGSWLRDQYPSPMMKFLLCLGVQPDLADPGKPYLKPYVERSIRTLKHECLWPEHPENALHAQTILRDFKVFYNTDRPHQSDICANRPPYQAFPKLPTLRPLPMDVDPDAWLTVFHRRIFKRKVGSNGMTQVDNQNYYLGSEYAGQWVGFLLDAQNRIFNVLYKGAVIKQMEIPGLVGRIMTFDEFLKKLLGEARLIQC